MVEPTSISPLSQKEGIFVFSKIYPSNYLLNMKYKSFDLVQEVSVSEDKSIDLTFPAEFQIKFDVTNSYGNTLSNGEITLSRKGKTKTTNIDEKGKAAISIPPGKYDISVFSEGKIIAKQTIDVKGDKNIDILSSVESFINTLISYLGIILLIFSIVYILWKRKFLEGIKLITIALLIIALVSPWWVLNGDNQTTETSTKTLLVPSKITTFSSSTDVIGGGVSQVPDEVTMVLGLLSILVGISCVIIFVSILIKNRLKRTGKILTVLSIIFIVLILFLFYYVMSLITEVGVGNFIGSGDIDTSLPGIAESEILSCNWGPGVGFYLGIFSLIILIFVLIFNKIKSKFLKQ